MLRGRPLISLGKAISRCYLAPSISSPISKQYLSTSRILWSKENISREDEFERLMSRSRKPAPRKRRPIAASYSKTIREPTVVSIALAESFDILGIQQDAGLNTMFKVRFIDEDFDNAVHLAKKLEFTVNPTELQEIFIFDDGVVVFWNVESTQRVQLLRELEKFTSGSYESRIVMEEQDRMPFVVSSGESTIKHDRFHLSEEKHGKDHRSFDALLERFAFSQAFAASVKIGVWECLLSELSEPLAETTKSLRKGIIPWNRKEALMKAGEFAALRHSINLDSDLLNSDFYWERANIEHYYNISSRHFTLNKRLSQLNNKLDYCEEHVKMVDNVLALRHASTLEWMIIVLIVIEVFFDIFHFADRSPKKVVVVASE